MSRHASPSTDRPYGVPRVTRLWGVSRATVYRQRRRPPAAIGRRPPGPRGARPDDELVAEIRALLERPARSAARATARSGRGRASRASGRPGAGSCA